MCLVSYICTLYGGHGHLQKNVHLFSSPWGYENCVDAYFQSSWEDVALEVTVSSGKTTIVTYIFTVRRTQVFAGFSGYGNSIYNIILLLKKENVHLICLIGIMVRVFDEGPKDQGSIPGRVIPKTWKMVLDASWLNSS